VNDRLKRAFTCPTQLTTDDLADMVAAMRKDAASAAKRRNRLQNTGGSNGRDAERNAAYRQRRAELRALKTAWG
jgi:hypothetical protein